MDRQHDWEQIADYVSGRATPEVRAAVETRLRGDPAFAADVAGARLAWDRGVRAFHAVTPADTDRAWLRLAAELHDAAPAMATGPQTTPAGMPLTGPVSAPAGAPRTTPVIRLEPRRRRAVMSWKAAALAASIVAVAGVGIMLGTGAGRGGPGADVEIAVREIVAGPGQRVAVNLPDGGRVILAPGSNLRAPEHFGATERRVSLSGHAYFEVAHDARPFLVETDGVDVRVLGTEFDVIAYPGEATAEVVVRSGSVAIRPKHSPTARDTVLGSGDRGVVDDAGRVHLERGVNVDALLAWTTGRLVFERRPLGDIIRDLERWYDVSIELRDPGLATQRVTAAFDREPLEIVLQTLGEIVNANVAQDGAHVVFTR